MGDDLASLQKETFLTRMVAAQDGDCSSLEHLRRRLAETIGWCSKRANAKKPATCLRTEDLKPTLLERSRWDAVVSVTAPRQNQLMPGWTQPEFTFQEPAGGRLLIYFPDLDLCDGAAEAISEGYFDVHNTPPWDTWIALFDDGGHESDYQYLLSWVPPALIDLAEAGVEVNPEECIKWLDSSSVRLRAILNV